uniref:Uncharacterized protein n=1 Tax=Lepeophtheirus salmonis TaxID=72036 RepID=A0A0K2TKE2_LEPSM
MLGPYPNLEIATTRFRRKEKIIFLNYYCYSALLN